MPTLRMTLSTCALLLVGAVSASADVVRTDAALARANEAKDPAKRAKLGGPALIDASGLEFFIQTDVTFTTSSSASGAASEASYTQAVAASTSMGGTTMSTLSDAFDGYLAVCLTFDGLAGPCESAGGGGKAAGAEKGAGEYFMYNINGPATVDVTCGDGGNLLLPVQSIGGLEVRREVFVPSDDELIRWATVITNPGAATVDFDLITSNNLGSDGATVIDTSSSGDNVVTTGDFWATSYEDYSGGTSSDPRLGHVFQEDGFDTLGGITMVDGDDTPFWHYPLRLDPGQTLTVLNFTTGQPNLPDAADQAADLARTPDYRCLTAGLDTLHNFSAVGGPVNPLEIPTSSVLGLLALAAVLAGTGLWVVRGRG